MAEAQLLCPLKQNGDNSFGPFLEATTEGITYAIASGYVDVINMSFGGSPYSTTWQNLINAGNNQGIVFVAAAGNSNSNIPKYPASYNHVISVAATNQQDLRAGFSSYGSTIDVSAPGTNILSSVASSTDAYDRYSGTSMASPLTAGLCALMKSYNNAANPDLIEECLKFSSTDIDAINPSYSGQLGAGRIDAQGALSCLGGPPIAQFSSDVTRQCPGGQVSFFDESLGIEIVSWNWNFPGGNLLIQMFRIQLLLIIVLELTM